MTVHFAYFLSCKQEKQYWGGFFLVVVAGEGLSQGRVCRREGLSWGGFVAGEDMSQGRVCRGVGLSQGGFVWGGFVAGRVCRREGLSGVGLSVYRNNNTSSLS